MDDAEMADAKRRKGLVMLRRHVDIVPSGTESGMGDDVSTVSPYLFHRAVFAQPLRP